MTGYNPPMITRRIVTALFFAQLVAVAALAQSAGTAEFGRAGGDEIALPVKQPGGLSGSFGLNTSNVSRGFTATAGGALMADRLWFFAAANRDEFRQPVLGATDAKLIVLPNARQSVTASSAGSALSLHFTGIVSSNSVFTAKIESRRSEPAFFTHW